MTMTRVLVADAGCARMLVQASKGSSLVLVDGMDMILPIPITSDVVRDSLPRTFDSVGPGWHAIAPRSEPHRAEKQNFAKRLVRVLEDGLAAAAYELVLLSAKDEGRPPRVFVC